MPEFCLNSRRWLDFIFTWCPKTCPHESEGCIYAQCGYYEIRKPTKWYLQKKKILKAYK